MCGIAGKLDFAGPVDPAVLHRMCRAMEHRGPDARGVHVEDGVGLGVQRLAVIDIAGGNQPLFNEDGTVAVVMNGEIYNHEELRGRLVRRGHRFASRVDTEVLVHLYEDHGDDLVRHLRGMFAFALWDARRRRLLCARDRVGKKPLFWARRGSRFWFASELRALLEDPELERAVDHAALAAYLSLQYVPHPLCAVRGIRKLAPASILAVDSSGERIDGYWSLDYTRKLDGVARPELEAMLREKIWEATRIRLMSEVPLGAFLSGGIDSSAVVAAMAATSPSTVRTFSISFSDQRFDEAPYARLVAERFGTAHTELEVRPDALAILPRLVRHYGEPFADSSAIPTFYLAELASRHVTVALNGDGGDESFAGYDGYVTNDRVTRYLGAVPRPLRSAAAALGARMPDGPHFASLRSRVRRRARLAGMEPWERHFAWMAAFRTPEQSERLLTPEFGAAVDGVAPETLIADAWRRSAAQDRVDRMLAVDVRTYLPGDLLVKVDIATMAHSLEARSPLLDHELMELAASVPAGWKLRGREKKVILRSALRGIVPDEILDRPKQGFSIPLAQWLRHDLRELPADVLLDPRTRGRGYFREGEIERMIREHREGTVDHGTRLWTLIQLELWHREVLEAPIAAAAS